jgi:tRNA (guanine10-N2)-dimethyltransferase
MLTTVNMEIITVLSKDNPKIAEFECNSLICFDKYTITDNIIKGETSSTKKTWKRLAYTNYILKPLYKETITNFLEKISIDIPKEFTVVMIKNKSDKRITSIDTKKRLSNLKGNTKKLTNYAVVVEEEHAILCEVLWENPKDYLQRKPQMRPAFHPASIHPKLARASVNLTGIRSGTIYDPMCGVGGILIESRLMGLKTIGSDIDKEMLNKSKINLKHYKAPAKLFKKDALTTNITADAIITDLPYCKSTKKIDNLEQFYLDFLIHIKTLTKNAVIMFPDFVNVKKIVKKSGWKIKEEFTYYLHRSLSKKILILNPTL